MGEISLTVILHPMMPKQILLLLFLTLLSCQVQNDTYVKEIQAYQKEHNEVFLDPVSSPLTAEQRAEFEGHDFFPINAHYKVLGKFEPTPDAKAFQMATSIGGNQLYRRLGILHFELEGESLSLEAYLRIQGFGLSSKVNYVFLPVADLTNGETTYSGGRYLHFEGIQEGDQWEIDFNKLYNPLCVYDERRECPLVPAPNYLPVKIEAGIKGF